jgi:hypothetical protein
MLWQREENYVTFLEQLKYGFKMGPNNQNEVLNLARTKIELSD